MKCLAFLFSVFFLLATAQAQPASTTGTPPSLLVGPAPVWGGVIDKYAKEGMPEPAGSTDVKLETASELEQERTSQAAKKAAAARNPAQQALAGSPSAAATPMAAQNAVVRQEPGHDDDWSKNVKESVKDLVQPFKEILVGPNGEIKPEADPVAVPEGSRQQPSGKLANAARPRSELERQREKIRNSLLIDELLEEVKPWAIGAGLLAFGGFCVRLWMGNAKSKKQRVASSASRSGPASAYSASGSSSSLSHKETDSARGARRKIRRRI